MATTYDRMRIVLGRLARKRAWDATELAEEIRRRAEPEFRIRGDGKDPNDYMKVDSIRRLIRLLVSLNLAESVSEEGSKISITENGRTALDKDRFPLQVQSCVKSYFYDVGIRWATIKAAADAIKLPEVPDARTIYTRLSDDRLAADAKMPLAQDIFSTLLFLYACAGGAKRVVRVHYVDII